VELRYAKGIARPAIQSSLKPAPVKGICCFERELTESPREFGGPEYCLTVLRQVKDANKKNNKENNFLSSECIINETFI
jgi:hypothetical protein